MAITKLSISECIQMACHIPVLDVRSPSEFAKAHIPGAFSLPLFNDSERAIIGTAYKQQSRETAIKLGLNAFGKNLVSLVETAEQFITKGQNESRNVIVHCWRGGMRSAAVAWLLDLYGFKVYVLSGGYKQYRTWALHQFEENHNLILLGGYTGTNKTGILLQFQKRHPNVIDLEGLAKHKGSAFGNLEQVSQPTQEHFENLLAHELYHIKQKASNKVILLEGESQRIGNVNIPTPLYAQMKTAKLLFLEVPFEQRLKHIVEEYSKHDREKIINAIVRLKKRLGGLETKNAINALLEDDIVACFKILLNYYDKLYLKSTYKLESEERSITHIHSEVTDASLNLEKILTYVN